MRSFQYSVICMHLPVLTTHSRYPTQTPPFCLMLLQGTEIYHKDTKGPFVVVSKTYFFETCYFWNRNKKKKHLFPPQKTGLLKHIFRNRFLKQPYQTCTHRLGAKNCIKFLPTFLLGVGAFPQLLDLLIQKYFIHEIFHNLFCYK